MKKDLKIDPKNLVQGCQLTLGDLLGTPREPSWPPGPQIDDSRGRFDTIFDSQSMKLTSKSMLRASPKLIPSYIIQFDVRRPCKGHRRVWLSLLA